jgi:hypothetical protein
VFGSGLNPHSQFIPSLLALVNFHDLDVIPLWNILAAMYCDMDEEVAILKVNNRHCCFSVCHCSAC